MVLWLIGLGLYDENDITLRGFRLCANAHAFTWRRTHQYCFATKRSLWEELYGREVIVADREMVESEAERILKDADKEDVAFLVVGDPFGATTHTDLQLRARQQGIPVKVVHNASVMNAVGACGLQLYRFGESISIVFFTDTWRPDSFYDRIRDNRRAGVHTLCLLDIKVKEPNLEKLARGRVVYEPPRYMSVNTAVEQLLEVESRRGEGAYGPDTLAIGIARLQADDQLIVAAPMSELKGIDFGAPLHSLVIAGSVHVMEEEMIECFRIRNQPGLKPYTPQLAASDDESGL